MLKTDITQNGSIERVVLEGKLDANTSKDLKTRLAVIPDNINEVVLDLEKLLYTSSAGLRVMLQLHNQLHQRGGKVKILHPNDMIMETFEDTGLADCLNIVR